MLDVDMWVIGDVEYQGCEMLGIWAVGDRASGM